MINAKLLNLTSAQYHAGWGETPHLSKSIAQILLDRSPLHAWHAHPNLGGAPHQASETMNRGSIIHALLLGKGSEVVVINHDDYRTNAAKADRDAAINAGKIPIKSKDFAEISTAADSIRVKLVDLGFDLRAADALVEQPIEWDEDGQDAPVRCKAMFDWVNIANGQILDLKSIEDASPESAARAVFRYGYHMQDAGYRSALDVLREEYGLDGQSTFTFLFVELDAPYGVLPAKLSGAFREIGESRWRAAVRSWENCLLNKNFPDYSREVVRLEPPGWALSKLIEDDL